MAMKDDEIEVLFGIIPCYFNLETEELRGKNQFFNAILNIYLWIESKLGYLIIEKIKKDD